MAFENEWASLQQMSAQMAGLRTALENLRAQHGAIQDEISAIVPSYDEEGNDLSAAYRNSLESDLLRVGQEMNAVENQMHQITNRASSLSGQYSAQSRQYSDRASNHNQAAAQFQRINGRFGASTARAGSAAASQHSQHYQSLANEMDRLASAAQQVASGGFVSGGSGEVADYGRFHNPSGGARGGARGAESGGGASGASNSVGSRGGSSNTSSGNTSFGNRPPRNRPPGNRPPGNTSSGNAGGLAGPKSNLVNDATLGFLGIAALPSNNGQTDFSPVSHGTVTGDFTGATAQNKADAAFAAQNGISEMDAYNYRTQNGLTWVVDPTGTRADLVPQTFADSHAAQPPIQPGKPIISGPLSNGSDLYNSMITSLNADGVAYNSLMPFPPNQPPGDIVTRLSGGDLTEGSCSSLALAYAGNRAGYDVLDFRDGDSRDFFSQRDTIEKIANLPGVKSSILRKRNDISSANELLKSMEPNKEYYLATGQHAAIVRKAGNQFEYLELQHPSSLNGWHNINDYILEQRFGCSSFRLFTQSNFLIDVDSLSNNQEFISMLGYINTAGSAQRKGAWGNVR